jgi:hypothetical protein
MNKVIVDSAMHAKLNGTDAELEFVDPAGKTLGFFVPTVERERLKQVQAENDRLLIAWGWSQLSSEDIERSQKDTKLYTTEEVIKHLESL